MNILHHKSWHVRNKDNIQRVRRDEEKAALEEKERQRKIALAEQEARTEFLRKKSRKHLEDAGKDLEKLDNGKSVESRDVPGSSYGADAVSDNIHTGRHINFFKETDGMIETDRKNAEHEAEKKAEQEEWEKKVGILTYLGQSSNETSAAWYNQTKRKYEEEEDNDYERQKRREKKRKLQDHLDPIHQMKSYLDKKNGKEGNEKHKKHKKKKHKHDKEKTGKKHTSDASMARQKTKPSIEQLRAERLKREVEEKQRTAQLLAKLRGEKIETEPAEEPQRRQKYNSQYNPDFAKQFRRKDRD